MKHKTCFMQPWYVIHVHKTLFARYNCQLVRLLSSRYKNQLNMSNCKLLYNNIKIKSIWPILVSYIYIFISWVEGRSILNSCPRLTKLWKCLIIGRVDVSRWCRRISTHVDVGSSRVRPIYWLANIFGQYRYIGQNTSYRLNIGQNDNIGIGGRYVGAK